MKPSSILTFESGMHPANAVLLVAHVHQASKAWIFGFEPCLKLTQLGAMGLTGLAVFPPLPGEAVRSGGPGAGLLAAFEEGIQARFSEIQLLLQPVVCGVVQQLGGRRLDRRVDSGREGAGGSVRTRG